MAFPFIYESQFENATTPFGWDSETDDGVQLDVAHYSELARYPWSRCAPFSGAYCLRAVLSGATDDAFVLEGDIDIADNTSRYVKFDIWISPTFTGTANDTINIFEAQSSGPVIEVAFGLRIVATTNVINFGIGKLAPTSWGAAAIERGVWYTVELFIHLDESTNNDGTVDLYVTKHGEPASASVFAAQVASLNQAAVIQGVLGVQDHLDTTTGVILFDNFKFDDARVYPQTRRYDDTYLLTQSSHAFVGPGVIDNITLMSGAGTDCVVSLYDTDTADTNDPTTLHAELKNTANNELVDPAGMPVDIVRGAYVTMSGTNPRALVKVCRQKCYSDALVRDHGLRRKV